MSIETTADWEGLREAAKVARKTLDLLSEQVRPGVTTGELDALAAQVFASHGARSAPALVYGFPGIVLISINGEIVHGIPGARRSPPATSSRSMSRWRRMATWSTPPAASSSSRPVRPLDSWSPARLRRFRPPSPWLVPAFASTRSGERWSARFVAEGFLSWRACQGTASVERFMKSRQCRIATTRCSRTS